MVQLMGVQLPDNRPVHIALTHVYGIGPATAERICAELSFHRTLRVERLSEPQLAALAVKLSGEVITGERRREVRANIARLRDIGSYRGRRHAMHLPVRGQNTRSNGNTARKLNRLERRGFATIANARPPVFPALVKPLSIVARLAKIGL